MFTVPYLTSCNHCREKKRKCNGEKPTCSLCRAHGVPCEYRRSRRFRKRVQAPQAMPLHTIMPAPGQQVRSDTPNCPRQDSSAPPTSYFIPVQPQQPSSTIAPASSYPVASVFPQQPQRFSAPLSTPAQQQQQQQQQQQTPSTSAQLPNNVAALSRLLAGDMYPQTQQLPQPVLQGINTYMSPFANPWSQSSLPEWIGQQKPEAEIISNLENIANAHSTSPLLQTQYATSPGCMPFSNLNTQLMSSLDPFQINQLQQQQMDIALSGSQESSLIGSLSLPTMLSSVSASAAGIPINQATGGMGSVFVQSPTAYSSELGNSSMHSQSPSTMDMGNSPGAGQLLDGELQRLAGTTDNLASGGAPKRNSTTDTSEMATSFSQLLSSAEATPKSAQAGSFSTFPAQRLRAQRRRSRSELPAVTSAQRLSDLYVPPVIEIYAREFPAELSPEVLLRVIRMVFTRTRTSLVNVDIELAWFMMLRGVIPRIWLFAFIASMARGHVIDQALAQQLPANFDESCYEYAVRDVPLVAASPSLWSALSLHLIARYEFQSARYDLMQQHFEMAADILAKTKFHGYAFPWTDVPEAEKQSFEFDYYVYTYWVGFQWHLVCCFNLDRPFNMDLEPAAMPMPTCGRGYFAPNLPCSFDLLTILPANSWPQSSQNKGLTKVPFRGFSDTEFEAWRPAEWKTIAPNYKITVALQQMLPLGAMLYRLQCEFCEGKLTLVDYLQRLRIKQERLNRWQYSLPDEFEITPELVVRLYAAGKTCATPGVESNIMMNFKELVMTLGLYNSLVIRANRVALLGMLREDLASPATSMHMRVFGIRDYIEAQIPQDDERGNSGLWQRNMEFHRCRSLCYESIDILCDVVQISFMLRLNVFTYGTTYVAIAGEMINVLISQLGINDRHVKWRTKTRLAHVLCLVRSLQHWAPALYLFVYAIRALSDPGLVLEGNVKIPTLVDLVSRKGAEDKPTDSDSSKSAGVGGEQALVQAPEAAGEAGVPDIPNPFPSNHIINLIVAELDLSLATFLAPAYPMLLLKIFAGNSQQ